MNNVISTVDMGLTAQQYDLIVRAVFKDPAVDSAYIFGSRAIGTFKEGSDIDIAIAGKKITLDTVARILETFEYSTLPYKVDIVVKNQIESVALLEHIKEHGVEIKRKGLGSRLLDPR